MLFVHNHMTATFFFICKIYNAEKERKKNIYIYIYIYLVIMRALFVTLNSRTPRKANFFYNIYLEEKY
ncbi:hypothetical protein ACMBCN_02430, partial [Candidatus Liberibacter asiaticus]|nr:hypothetical protein [Candidatus Liberibacter asiaticus]